MVTVGSEEEGAAIASTVVSEQLAACVKVFPVTSTYRWQGTVQCDREWQLIIKTQRDCFQSLESRIRTLHSYDVPEIVAMPIVQGSHPYLSWLEQELSQDCLSRDLSLFSRLFCALFRNVTFEGQDKVMGLSEQLNDPQIHAKIAEDCTTLMDEQVSDKKGLGGMAIKAAYGVLKGIGPSYITRAILNLLPKAIVAIDPLWAEGIVSGDPVSHLSQHKAKAADILLGVTDHKIANAQNKVVIATYNKLRKSVQGDVEAAVPEFAKIISRYA